MYVFENGILVKKNGIQFPAVANLSADTNTLDDYEENTWSITDTSGAGLGVLGTGYYTKIGRLVHITAQFTIPVNASGTQVRISVPFASSAGLWSGGAVIPFVSTGVPLGLMINPGTTDAYGYNPNAAAVRAWSEFSGAIIYAWTTSYITSV